MSKKVEESNGESSEEEEKCTSPWLNTQLIDIKLTNNSWKPFYDKQKERTYFKQLNEFIEKEKSIYLKSFDIYPPPNLVYNCLNLCNCEDVKVVIIGQDPYHGAGQAMGLSFSVPNGIKIPPSLKNIHKELKNENEITKNPTHGDLSSWNEQGVMLLNTALTVREKKAGSHAKYWGTFADKLIKHLSERGEIVFILWGNHAKNKTEFIDIKNNNYVLTATHPSPMASNKGGFFGCNNFTDCNNILTNKLNKQAINWDSINN